MSKAPLQIKDCVKELRRVKASSLVPNLKNYRTHPERQRKLLSQLFGEIGYADALLAYELPDGRLQLIDGHLRAELTPDQEVPVLILDVTEAEANKLLLTLDPLAALAETDSKILDDLLRSTPTTGDLEAWLKERAEDAILPERKDWGKPQEKDPARYQETCAKWPIRLGEVWALGDHRLLCGDSSQKSSIDLLMAGRLADVVFTDPPYNVGESGCYAKDASPAMKELASANWDKGFSPGLALSLLPLAKNVTVYVCTSHPLAPAIWAWMSEWADHHSYCVWSKSNPMPSLAKRHWTWNTELICYATRGKHTFHFPKQGHALSTWEIGSIVAHRESDHPTEKPRELIHHALSHSSNKGDLVFDGFLGSGTTLVACEDLGRVCYGVEINPEYCAVICERWHKQTGQSPKRVSSVGSDTPTPQVGEGRPTRTETLNDVARNDHQNQR